MKRSTEIRVPRSSEARGAAGRGFPRAWGLRARQGVPTRTGGRAAGARGRLPIGDGASCV